jgi:hypothetical protein
MRSRREFMTLFLSTSTFIVTRQIGFPQANPFYTPSSPEKGAWDFQRNPDLPNVLLLGDSITGGYSLDVRRMLADVANVYPPPENCGNTKYGLAHIQKWIDGEQWAVIHFNFGLHDLCYRSPASHLYGNRDKVHGVQDVPIVEYRVNLEEIVRDLKRVSPLLIWADTTIVPPNEAGRFPEDVPKYNAVADAIMRKERVSIDALYELTSGFPPDAFIAPGDVHYTAAGYQRIAEQVSSTIRKTLAGAVQTPRKAVR